MTDPGARSSAAADAPPPVAAATTAGTPSIVAQCPRCSAAVLTATSDFCEQCSAHLYPGHCVFCLERFAPGQAFCRQCGMPPDGVTCGACGTFSRFDFCPNPDCGAGLTPRAATALEQLAHDPEAVAVFAELDAIGEILADLDALPAETVADAAADTPHAAEAPHVSDAVTAPASDTPAPRSRPSLTDMRAAVRKAQSGADKASIRRLAEQASAEALNSIASRTFPTAQQARVAGTALQVALRFREVNERLEIVAWKCNAFNCEHPMPGGMSSCADPSRGGVPVTHVIRVERDASAEFSV